MEQQSKFEPIYEQIEPKTDIMIVCTFVSDPFWDPASLEISLDYGSFPEILLPDEQPAYFEKTTSKPIDIKDPVFEETYTAYVSKKASKWSGRIPDVPGVECEKRTKKELLETLADKTS